jgi:uncharacterized protein (TIGR03083 family)
MKERGMIRDAYQQAARCFGATVAEIQDSQWQHMALGEWTVRDLVGHTNRALLTVETYLNTPARTVDLDQPAAYFIQAKAALADPAAVAARGREAGQALGPNPGATVRETVSRVLQKVDSAADDVTLTTPVGGMRLIDYLPTRVFELTVHTLDLGTALGTEIAVPEAAAAVTLRLIADLAWQSGKAAPVMLATTGRRSLPPDFSLL